jgi:hypothetical protein
MESSLAEPQAADRRGFMTPRFLACLAPLILLASAGCAAASTPLAAAARSRGCGAAQAGDATAAQGAASSGALPPGLLAISAVPGTQQAWAVGDRFPAIGGPYHSYLLRFTGLDWVKVATFRPWVELAGVSAMSQSSAWVWGTGYLALVSGAAVRRLRSPWLKGLYIAAVASDGTADTWLVGGNATGLLAEHWDGRSWHRTALPAGASFIPFGATVTPLSTDGPMSAWLALDPNHGVAQQRVLHWNGVSWTWSYAPPARLYEESQNGSGPDQLSVAASAGRAWVVYTEERAPSGNPIAGSPNEYPTAMLSVYFDGRRWTAVHVRGRVRILRNVAMSGANAWAIAYFSPVLLCSHLGGPWQVMRLPPRDDPSCRVWLNIAAMSPPYVIEAGIRQSTGCARSYGFVYESGHWRPVRPG